MDDPTLPQPVDPDDDAPTLDTAASNAPAEDDAPTLDTASPGEDDATLDSEGGTGNPSLAQVAGALGPGAFVGGYHILRKIGEGGMGVVFEAEQQNPKRRVALKIINAGLATNQLLRRFEFEAQVLGQLQHPGIAQIYEAGTFQLGHAQQPYFAMEYIHGQPLNRYCENKNLGTRQRIELFIKICLAIQHAHAKGIIHRDLKPGNILIDAAGQPKVLDFGVARTTDADTMTATLQTDVGQLVGTVPYMSPEQAGGDPNDLDTRSDVYALGVVCYQLLTGRLPYDVRNRMVHEAVRVIREEDPAPLSQVSRLLKGDIETIVAKALEKDKGRRYPTPIAFSTDFERYLRNDPIEARPPSRGYQIKKFAQRNRALVLGALAVFAVLIAGVVVSSMLYMQAEEERDRAEHELETALLGQQFVKEDMLASIDPRLARGHAVTMRDALDNAAQRIGDRFAGKPEAEANIRTTIGHTYLNLDETQAAQYHLQKAHDLYLQTLGANHRKTFDARDSLAAVLRKQGQLDEAIVIWTQVLDQRIATLGTDHRDTLAATLNLALAYRDAARFDDAKQLFLQGLAGAQQTLGADHPVTLQGQQNYAQMLRGQGQYDQVERFYKHLVVARAEQLGDDHPALLQAVADLAYTYYLQGDYATAQRAMSRALTDQRRVLGSDHVDTASTMLNLGTLYKDQGKFDQALALLKEAVAVKRAKLEPDNLDLLSAVNQLAGFYWTMGRYADALPLWTELHHTAKVHPQLGPDHPTTVNLMVNLGLLHRAMGQYDQALALLVEGLSRQRALLGVRHRATLNTINALGNLYWVQGQYDQALKLWVQALDLSRDMLGEEHPDTILALNNLGLLYRDMGQYSQALKLLEEARGAATQTLGDEHPHTLLVMNSLAWLYVAMERFDDALPWNRQAMQTQEQTLGQDHPRTLTSRETLALIHHGRGEHEQALALILPTLQTREANLGGDHPDTLHAADTLARIDLAMGNWPRAQALTQRTLEARQRTLGAQHPHTLESLNTLAQIHLAQGQQWQATVLYRQCLAGRRDALGQDHPLTRQTQAALNALLAEQ